MGHAKSVELFGGPKDGKFMAVPQDVCEIEIPIFNAATWTIRHCRYVENPDNPHRFDWQEFPHVR